MFANRKGICFSLNLVSRRMRHLPSYPLEIEHENGIVLPGTVGDFSSGNTASSLAIQAMITVPMRRPNIGVFDSGFGGLTVLKALLELIPVADYLYFGDTARLPYGSKSAQTVAKYAVEATQYLEQQGAVML